MIELNDKPRRTKKKKKFDIVSIYPLIFTIIFVIILFQYSFSSLEAIFYDIRARFDLGINYSNNIVLITMDEESDEFLGETYPYTYSSHERLFKRLGLDSPSIVNYLVEVREPETSNDARAMKRFVKQVELFKSRPGHDFRFGTGMDSWGEQTPPKNLQHLEYSLALINVDNGAFAKDDVSRRALLYISGEESLHLWTANTYRAMKGKSTLDTNSIKGAYYVREADATFSLFRYATSPKESNGKVQKIPFHRVIVGNFPKGFFTNKIVIVGPSYLSSRQDFTLTPFNKDDYSSPKLNVHASIIQSLIENKTIYQVPRNVSYALAILIAIFLSLTISRVKPTHGLLITVVVLWSLLLISFLLFSIFGLWLYITHLVFTVFVVYYIWVPFRAIGEYQRRYAIQEETKLLKKVESLKQNFISLMSHDLKTPVARIAGIADNLTNRHTGNSELTKGLFSIIDSTKELNKFITSILDLTKIESRNLTLNMVSKDVNTVIEQIVGELKFEMKDKSVEIQTDLAPLYPIHFDMNLMKRVISNLVENALKYSGPNSTVNVRTYDDQSWVYIEIEDNGAGIPAEDIDFIFEKFYRVKNDASHSIKGTGLGLFLVKYFVELHGGSIIAESQVGSFTKFKIKLKNA